MARRRARRTTPPLALTPWRRTDIPYAPIEPLSADQIEAIHEASLKVLSEHGMRILSPYVRGLYKSAGNRVDETTEMVYFDPGYIEEAVAKAPSSFTIHARNPQRSCHIGGNTINFGPVGGPSFTSDLDRGRRSGSYEDLCNYQRLIQMIGALHLGGVGPFVALDLPADTRHLDAFIAGASYTDKVFSQGVIGRGRASDTLNMLCILHGYKDIDELAASGKVYVKAGVNTNSPRQLDEPLSLGMLTLVEAGQAAVITPFTLLGAMAPTTIAGALTLQNAEALAGIALCQTFKPGSPVVYGGFTSNVDMKSGAPAFGTPEYVQATLAGGQLARRYALPYRSSNTNASNCNDAQAAYESQMSLWAVVMGHANVVWHSAGWLEGGLVGSFEKLIIDAEMLQMMQAWLDPITVDADTLAVDAIGEVEPGGHFFGSPHTLERYDTIFYDPLVSDWRNFETWEADGMHDTAWRANRTWKRMLEEYQQPELDEAVAEGLRDYAERRKQDIQRNGLDE
ncbi:MAG: methyltransferase [Thiotrichales bacterium]|nr:methyltransferase [Thiotrichales bacterium]